MTVSIQEVGAMTYNVVGACSPTVTSYKPLRVSVSIDVELSPVEAVSPAAPSVARHGEVPRPSAEERFSLRDMLGKLGRAGHDGFRQQSGAHDAHLRKRYEAGEISPLYFYRCLTRMTQEQLAERASTRQSFVSQLEQRKRPLTWKQAKKLAPALGVEAAKLMERA